MKALEYKLIKSMQWVLKPENSLLWHKTVLEWINKYSGIEKENDGLSEQYEKLEL